MSVVMDDSIIGVREWLWMRRAMARGEGRFTFVSMPT